MESRTRAYAEFIDLDDHAALLAWAREVCRDISVDDAARFLGTAATLDAVVDALTDSLPDPIRGQAAEICEEGFKGFERAKSGT